MGKTEKRQRQRKEHSVRVGGFLVRTYRNPQGIPYVEARAVEGMWRMSWRIDSGMYPLLVEMSREEEYREYLSAWLHLQYVLCGSLADGQLLREELEAYGRFQERRAAAAGEVPEGEQERALEDAAMLHSAIELSERAAKGR